MTRALLILSSLALVDALGLALVIAAEAVQLVAR